MRRSGVVDCPVVVVDRQKSIAGLAYSLYERSDLPSEACGFVGVLYTNWRPTSGAEAFLYFGEHGRSYVRTLANLQVSQMADFSNNLLQRLKKCHTGHAAALSKLVVRSDSWTITGKDIDFPALASLEQVVALPGFGALVSGWALSPLKEIETFALRIGSVILACDRQSLYFKARPDLAGVFPGNDRLLPTAGFVAAFRGYLPADDLRSPVLKVIYHDGTSTNHPTPVDALRRLGKSVDFSAATDLMP
jgi:hypothetical protein